MMFLRFGYGHVSHDVSHEWIIIGGLFPFVAIFIYWILFYFFGVGRDYSLPYRSPRNKPIKDFRGDVPQAVKDVLQRELIYYSKLDDRSKKEFERRVMKFIINNKFVPRRMKQVSKEQRVILAGVVIQVTFGLKPLILDHFNKIYVFPSKYISRFSRKYHYGEANPSGRYIAIAWDLFLMSKARIDGKNLGIHEVAHAVFLENKIKNEEYNFLDKKKLKAYHDEAEQVFGAKTKFNKDPLLRDYAFNNAHEFFAVCVENFFERPELFKKTHPYLYSNLAAVLNQDPLLNNNGITLER